MAETNITNDREFPSRPRSKDNLIFWSVCVDRENVTGVPISEPFDNIEKARQALEAMKGTYGDAYIVEREMFINPNRPGDIERREKMAASLH